MVFNRPSRISRIVSTGETSTASSMSSALSSSGGDSEDETLHTIHKRPSLLRNNTANNSIMNTTATQQQLSSTELLRLSAVQSYQTVFEGSKIPDQSHTYPKFDTREVQIGELLGQGGFANVYEVCGFTLRKDFVIEASMRDEDDDDDFDGFLAMANACDTTESKQAPEGDREDHPEEEPTDIDDSTNFTASETVQAATALHQKLDIQRQQACRQFLSQHCFRKKDDVSDENDNDTNSNNLYDNRNNVVARYALKRLKPVVVADPPTLLQGISDMATESRFLASLEYHPNIVKLRGMAQDRFSAGYFIIMDRLSDTIEQRIERVWKPAQKTTKLAKVLAKLTSSFDEKKRKLSKWNHTKNETLLPRLVASFGIASALAHLHKQGILYRDLKPANCGFDVRDDIKIFDFGLAKELGVRCDEEYHDNDDNHNPCRNNDTVFQLTAMCGTPRYMAPEVALGHPYNESCDVYSFAMMCWQILRLRKPYGAKCTFDLLQKVWNDESVRPELPAYWPEALRSVLKRAMSADLTKRPRMREIETVLKREFEVLSTQTNNGNGSGRSIGVESAGNAGEDATMTESPSSSKRPSMMARRRSTHVFRNGRGMGMKTEAGLGKGGHTSFFAQFLDSSTSSFHKRSAELSTNSSFHKSDRSLGASLRRKSDNSLGDSLRRSQSDRPQNTATLVSSELNASTGNNWENGEVSHEFGRIDEEEGVAAVGKVE